MKELSRHSKELLEKALSETGNKLTKQREMVFNVLTHNRDHPTAEEVYMRIKQLSPNISLATVYNCLEALVECGLVKQVNIEREPNRYCPNLAEHAHFHCTKTGRVYDIDLPESIVCAVKNVLPAGYTINNMKIIFEGQTPNNLGEDEKKNNL